jgi:hypothetical protein
VVSSPTARPHFTPGKGGKVVKAGWAPGPVWTGGKSRPHRDSIPDRPARSQSLYRLSYRAHFLKYLWEHSGEETEGNREELQPGWPTSEPRSEIGICIKHKMCIKLSGVQYPVKTVHFSLVQEGQNASGCHQTFVWVLEAFDPVITWLFTFIRFRGCE